MSRPEDIPENVWEASIKCAETALRNLDGDYGDMTIEITAIARAILAAKLEEREACAAVADQAKTMREELYAQNFSSINAHRAVQAEEIAQAIRSRP